MYGVSDNLLGESVDALIIALHQAFEGSLLAGKEALDQEMILGTPLIIVHSELPRPARP
jgi:hypothetical protein